MPGEDSSQGKERKATWRRTSWLVAIFTSTRGSYIALRRSVPGNPHECACYSTYSNRRRTGVKPGGFLLQRSKAASSTAKEEDIKMTRTRDPKLICTPLLQPDSWSMPPSDCIQGAEDFQPNLRQCLPGKPWVGVEVSKGTWYSRMGSRERHLLAVSEFPNQKALLISHLPQQLGWPLALGYLYPEIKGNSRKPWQRSLCHLHHWKCPLESKGGASLTLQAPGRMVQPPALPLFIPIPSMQIQTCLLPPTSSQCALSQEGWTHLQNQWISQNKSNARGLGVKCISRNIFSNRK